MNIDVSQYRGSIGQHYTPSRTPMRVRRNTAKDLLSAPRAIQVH